mmetsp:Transcript_16558/g.27363  ORF Transcript_16558/g.27363 Transcript_16558/m.27363 type:complete len:244 (-) Transcript_16558:426-1157(-)
MSAFPPKSPAPAKHPGVVQATTYSSNATYQSPRNREYLLILEFKHLKTHAPSGVYVMPSLDSMYVWYGVIFLRDGLYKGGTFKFVINIPEGYPDARPSVRFGTRIFHPQVSLAGDMDLNKDFPSWSKNNSLVQILTVIKKLFYQIHADNPMNKEAAELYKNNKEEYINRVEQSVLNSQSTVLSNPENSSLRLTEYKQAHDDMFKRVMGMENDTALRSDADEGFKFYPWFHGTLNQISLFSQNS